MFSYRRFAYSFGLRRRNVHFAVGGIIHPHFRIQKLYFQRPNGRHAAYKKHWISEGITFDAIYTGYLGSAKQIDYVKDFIKETLNPGGITVIDPAMADCGKLYPGFDLDFVQR